MHCLGVLYERGDGVPRDLVAAYQWYDLAAKHGSGADEQLREELAKQMTPEQMSEAQSQTSPNGPQKSVTAE
jgi:TPR repeat protein